MLADAVSRIYIKVTLSQCALMVGLALVAWASQTWLAALSALAGGVVVVVGSLAYQFIARQSKVTAVSARQVLFRHVLAEAAKIGIVLVLLLALMASNAFHAVWVLAGLAITLLGHWLALLIIK